MSLQTSRWGWVIHIANFPSITKLTSALQLYVDPPHAQVSSESWGNQRQAKSRNHREHAYWHEFLPDAPEIRSRRAEWIVWGEERCPRFHFSQLDCKSWKQQIGFLFLRQPWFPAKSETQRAETLPFPHLFIDMFIVPLLRFRFICPAMTSWGVLFLSNPEDWQKKEVGASKSSLAW